MYANWDSDPGAPGGSGDDVTSSETDNVGSGGNGSVDDVTKASKVERRRARERESARRSRRRKKEQMDGLESRVKLLQEENQQLLRRKAHKDLMQLNESYAQQTSMLRQIMSTGHGDHASVQRIVGSIMQLQHDRRTVIRAMLEDLQQILEPIYRTEGMWFIVEGIGKYDPEEEVDLGSSSSSSAVRGNLRSLLCDRRTRGAAAASSAPPSEEEAGSNGQLFRETLAPMAEGEGAKELVRRVIKAMGVSHYQHMQAHLWISTHCLLLAQSRETYREMKQIVHRLQQLRSEHEAGWGELTEHLKQILPSFSVGQYAQFILFSDKYAQSVLSLIGLEAPGLRPGLPPPAPILGPPPHAIPAPLPPLAPPLAKRARHGEPPAHPLPVLAVKSEPSGLAHANGGWGPPEGHGLKIEAPPPAPFPPPIGGSGSSVPTIAEMMAHLRDVI